MHDGSVIESKRRIRILDIPVDRVTRAEAAEIFDALMRTEGCSLIVTPNSEILWNASKDAELKAILSDADLIIPDGIGLVYASRIIGSPLSERVTGIDFLDEALRRLAAAGESIYLLGSAPGIAEKAAERMRAHRPGLRVAGVRHGYYRPEEEAAIVGEINASGAAFLCAALGSPKQERFIHAHREALRVRAAIGVGGSLDVWAGAQKRAPAFFREHGLEWLYRLARQPSRIKRAAALPLFMLRVLASGKR
ncbi:MAG: WecB/TagA/CpsF family glycosyltransferase [Clostridiales Family XIII bacterium]|nr:WecB/TagA/CpsF family glycosyltransferase [Clostridiales Family XIII bacterium]